MTCLLFYKVVRFDLDLFTTTQQEQAAKTE